MKKFAIFLVALAFCLGQDADVQAHVPYGTYYQPVVVYSPPVGCAPHIVYYAPAPAPVVYQPVARLRTRYRPILGGVVTRVRYGYVPTYNATVPVVVAY